MSPQKNWMQYPAHALVNRLQLPVQAQQQQAQQQQLQQQAMAQQSLQANTLANENLMANQLHQMRL